MTALEAAMTRPGLLLHLTASILASATGLPDYIKLGK